MAEKQLIVCPSCGAKNRVDPAKVAQGNEPVCGRCKKPLPLSTTRSAGPVTVTDATFAAEVEQASLPVLLDLWAPWCGPCRMIAPMLEALAIELAGRVKIAKLNVDENPMTAGRLNVRSIPTLLLLKGGKEVDRIVGVMPKAELKQRVERSIAQSAAAGA
jgi:thioredoxin 2